MSYQSYSRTDAAVLGSLNISEQNPNILLVEPVKAPKTSPSRTITYMDGTTMEGLRTSARFKEKGPQGSIKSHQFASFSQHNFQAVFAVVTPRVSVSAMDD